MCRVTFGNITIYRNVIQTHSDQRIDHQQPGIGHKNRCDHTSFAQYANGNDKEFAVSPQGGARGWAAKDALAFLQTLPGPCNAQAQYHPVDVRQAAVAADQELAAESPKFLGETFRTDVPKEIRSTSVAQIVLIELHFEHTSQRRLYVKFSFELKNSSRNRKKIRKQRKSPSITVTDRMSQKMFEQFRMDYCVARESGRERDMTGSPAGYTKLSHIPSLIGDT